MSDRERARRARYYTTMRVQGMVRDGADSQTIAETLDLPLERVREIIDRMEKDVEPPPFGANEFTTVGAVRRMIHPHPSYETVRRMLARANIPVLAVGGGKRNRGSRLIPTRQLARFFALCMEDTEAPTWRERARVKRNQRILAAHPGIDHISKQNLERARAQHAAQRAAERPVVKIDPVIASIVAQGARKDSAPSTTPVSERAPGHVAPTSERLDLEDDVSRVSIRDL